MEDLTIAEQFMLICLDDKKGHNVSGVGVGYGLATAVLMELIKRKVIEIVEDKVYILLPKWNDRKQEALVIAYDTLAQAKTHKKLKSWIENLGTYKGDKLNKAIINSLLHKGVIRSEKRSFLRIFKWKSYPTLNPRPENQLRSRLRNVLNNKLQPVLDDIILLSLIDSFQLISEVFGKEQQKENRKKIVALLKEDNLAKSAGKEVKEMQEVLQAALMVMMIFPTTIMT